MLAWLLPVLLCLAPGCTAPAVALSSEPAPASPARCAPISRPEVEGLFERWNSALASADAAVVAALYSDDALLLPTLSDQPRDTPAAIRDYFEGFLARHPQGRIDSRQIRIGCNAALDAGTYSFRLTGAGGGPAAWVHARYTFVYVHGDDGWRIQHHHSSLQPPG
ncbi:MAG: SgcJ/EcaC family oxidoreductase [Vulcanococcus sp.]